MNRQEKNLQTHQRIMDSAFKEFSEKSYSEASLNLICSTGNISKGIVYHYFKDKDELYLTCVKECFDTLTNYLNHIVMIDNLPIEQAMANYFDARIGFFGEHPSYLGIFCSAVMNPPAHLLSAIEEITSDFDRQGASILTAMLQTVKLRPDVSTAEVVDIFRQYQDFVNARFQMNTSGENTLKDHEVRCRRSLQILLYGVIDREVEI